MRVKNPPLKTYFTFLSAFDVVMQQLNTILDENILFFEFAMETNVQTKYCSGKKCSFFSITQSPFKGTKAKVKQSKTNSERDEKDIA